MQKTTLLLSFLFWRITFAMAQQTDIQQYCPTCPSIIEDISVSTHLNEVSGATYNDLADSLQGVCGVNVYFTHEYIGDLKMTLISPGGQEVQLIGPTGLLGETTSNAWNVDFVPCNAVAEPDPGFAATWNNNQPWANSTSVFYGSYYPFNGCLETFDTGPVNGVWQLVVQDSLSQDVGIFFYFDLKFCRVVEQEEEPLFMECVNCPLQLPDYTTTTAFIQVEGSTNNNLADSTQGVCAVNLKFEHDYVGDLSVKLQSPAGQVVDLIGSAFLFGETDDTVWDIRFVPSDTVATPDPGFLKTWGNNQAWGTGNTYTGSYYPFAGALDSLNIGPVNGIWQVIFDDLQEIDSGFVYAISLEFCDQSGLDSILLLPPDALGVLDTGTWNATLQDTSLNAVYINVSWGDGTASNNVLTGSLLHHEYELPGIYNVQLIAFNAIGADTLNLVANIEGALPSADVIVPSLWCNSGVQRLKLENMEHVDNVLWEFYYGIPSIGSGSFIDLLYLQPVMDTGTVTISNSVGSVTYNVYINVIDEPSAAFTYEYLNGLYYFTNTSTWADSLAWYIDGLFVSSDSTIFIVPQVGVTSAEVALYAYNACGNSDFTQVISITNTEDAALLANGIRIFPNPVTTTSLTLETTPKTSDEYRWTLVDASGKTHESGQFTASSGLQRHTLTIGEHPAGVYWLQLQNSRESFQKRLIIPQ